MSRVAVPEERNEVRHRLEARRLKSACSKEGEKRIGPRRKVSPLLYGMDIGVLIPDNVRSHFRDAPSPPSMNTFAELVPGAHAASVPRSPSLSFVITSLTGGSKLRKILDLVRAAAQSGDEIVVLAAVGGEEEQAECRRSGARLVADHGASVFSLRARLPDVTRKEWLVLVEDHAMPEPQTIAALRTLIGRNPELEIVPFLTVNGHSKGPWAWASFLQTYALYWAPLPEPPPFCAPNNVVVRRDAVDNDGVLGHWEFESIPRVFARGKIGWSNEVTVAHEKQVGALAACLLHFRNGRTSAGVARKLLGLPRRVMLREIRKVMTERLTANRAQIRPRLSELPRGTMRRLTVLAAAHAMGWAVGTWFGAGPALTTID